MTDKPVAVPTRIGNWKCWVLKRREYWGTKRKTSQNKDKKQQQTQLTNLWPSDSRLNWIWKCWSVFEEWGKLE